MEKYAIIKIGGTQVMAKEGLVFELCRQKTFDVDVIAYSNGTAVEFGKPTLSDVVVKIKHVEDKLDDKVLVGRFKSKSRYRRRVGHRQPVSVLRIESILKKGEEQESTTKSKSEDTKQVKAEVKTSKPAAKTAKKTEKKPKVVKKGAKK